jgi:hypothetical protein
MKELYHRLKNHFISKSENNLIATKRAKEIIGEIYHIKGFQEKIEILNRMEKLGILRFKNRDLISINNEPDFIKELKKGKKCSDNFRVKGAICRGCDYYNKCLTIELNR